MKTNTPEDLKELFETMQEDVLESHHLSSEYLTDIVNIVVGMNTHKEISSKKPKDLIKWAEGEIKEYRKFIKKLEKDL